MTDEGDRSGSCEISGAFAARLARLEPNQPIRAIVMANVKLPREARRGRLSGAQRQARIEALRSASQDLLAEIDEILQRFGGTRLSATIDTLGSIVVETTRKGIEALSRTGHVKAILEDQDISPLPKPKR